jgi:hypothetical protein
LQTLYQQKKKRSVQNADHSEVFWKHQLKSSRASHQGDFFLQAGPARDLSDIGVHEICRKVTPEG